MQTSLFDKTDTLAAAKAELREKWEDGTKCPCCQQYVKLYRRKLTSAMAYGLILLERHPDGWVHIENYLKGLDVPSSIRGDFAKLRYWGLVEKAEGHREDGSDRNGYYRITPLGRDFVRGSATVQSHARLFNNQFFGMEGDYITIQKALGSKFNYSELINNVKGE